jgi:hypothetical protein
MKKQLVSACALVLLGSALASYAQDSTPSWIMTWYTQARDKASQLFDQAQDTAKALIDTVSEKAKQRFSPLLGKESYDSLMNRLNQLKKRAEDTFNVATDAATSLSETIAAPLNADPRVVKTGLLLSAVSGLTPFIPVLVPLAGLGSAAYLSSEKARQFIDEALAKIGIGNITVAEATALRKQAEELVQTAEKKAGQVEAKAGEVEEKAEQIEKKVKQAEAIIATEGGPGPVILPG